MKPRMQTREVGLCSETKVCEGWTDVLHRVVGGVVHDCKRSLCSHVKVPQGVSLKISVCDDPLFCVVGPLWSGLRSCARKGQVFDNGWTSLLWGPAWRRNGTVLSVVNAGVKAVINTQGPSQSRDMRLNNIKRNEQVQRSKQCRLSVCPRVCQTREMDTSTSS